MVWHITTVIIIDSDILFILLHSYNMFAQLNVVRHTITTTATLLFHLASFLSLQDIYLILIAKV